LWLGCLIPVTPALAYPPLPGTYRSSDLGGPLWTGGDFEGWESDGSLLSGTTVSLCSIEENSYGHTLYGNQWDFRCIDQNGPAVLIADGVDADGYGQRVYTRSFNLSTSLIYLGWSGPWGGTAAQPIFGRLDAFTDRITIQYEAGVPVSTLLTARGVGHFFNDPDYTVSIEIGQGVLIGTGSTVVIGPNSGHFYQSGCVPGAVNGARYEVTAITITIDGPAVPVLLRSWGRFKASYR